MPRISGRSCTSRIIRDLIACENRLGVVHTHKLNPKLPRGARGDEKGRYRLERYQNAWRRTDFRRHSCWAQLERQLLDNSARSAHHVIPFSILVELIKRIGKVYDVTEFLDGESWFVKWDRPNGCSKSLEDHPGMLGFSVAFESCWYRFSYY